MVQSQKIPVMACPTLLDDGSEDSAHNVMGTGMSFRNVIYTCFQQCIYTCFQGCYRRESDFGSILVIQYIMWCYANCIFFNFDRKLYCYFLPQITKE